MEPELFRADLPRIFFNFGEKDSFRAYLICCVSVIGINFPNPSTTT